MAFARFLPLFARVGFLDNGAETAGKTCARDGDVGMIVNYADLIGCSARAFTIRRWDS